MPERWRCQCHCGLRWGVAGAGCVLIALALAASPGCRPRDAATPPPDATPSAAPAARRPLRIITLDDSALSQSIAREWQANSQDEVEFETLSSEPWPEEPLDFDVIIFPSSLLGQLVTTRQIVPWPTAVPAADRTRDEELSGQDDYDWNDVFPWLRRRELRWGNELYGVTFGSPQLLLLYRSDLLAQWDLTPPTTWQEYGQLVAKLHQHIAASAENSPRFATLEPLGEGWAARMLLARAATYARHPNQYSTLFQFTTMKSWIDQPPFVRALEELTRDMGPVPAEVRALSPDQVMERLLRGETVMGVTWPSVARAVVQDVPPDAAFAILPLPGATEVFRMSNQTWEARADNASGNVPLLGAAGRMGAISRRARSPQAAQDFLRWVTRAATSSRISVRSTATTLFRSSHTARPQAWVESNLAPVASQFADAMVENQQQSLALMMLRIPGQGRYLQALDQAVQEAIAGQLDASVALSQVAETWTRLTDELGREAQREAYEASLGLEF